MVCAMLTSAGRCQIASGSLCHRVGENFVDSLSLLSDKMHPGWCTGRRFCKECFCYRSQLADQPPTEDNQAKQGVADGPNIAAVLYWSR